jgi:carbon-monoxide dehydrogenase large subunit
MVEFAIGQGVSRFEDPRLIRGGGRYTDDIKLPGMVHAVVLRSPYAHAKIKSIDSTAAKAAPGVLAVLTAADVSAAGYGDLPVPGNLKRRDGSPIQSALSILAEDRVRWVGDYIAFVTAETLAQAQDASELIRSTTKNCLPSPRRPRHRRQARRVCGTTSPTISALSN